MKRLVLTALVAVLLPVFWLARLQGAQQQPQQGTRGRNQPGTLGGQQQPGTMGRGTQPAQTPTQPQSICKVDGIEVPCTGPPICVVNGVVIPCVQPSRPRDPQPPATPGQVADRRRQDQAPFEILSGTVKRVDTEQPLPEVRLELKKGLIELPTGFDKPCKPTSIIETEGNRQFATTDATGHYVFQYDPAAEAARKTQEDEATRRMLELYQLQIQAMNRIASAPERLYDPASVSAAASSPDLTGRRLIPEREGYVQAPWRRSDSAGLIPITDVDMIPAPTIAGRVVDPSGKPLAAAVVQAWRLHYTPLGRTLKWTRSTLSSDQGDFRLSWLPFGNYYINAGHSSYAQQPWLESLRITPNLPEPDQGLPMLFYPGAVSATNASIVRIRIPQGPRASMPAPVITHALRERPRFHVRFRLVGDPMPSNVQVVFLPYGGDLCAGLDYAIKGNGDGTFDIYDVPQGLYVLVAIRPREVISELIPVNVEKNIDDLKLPLITPTEVRGTITFDSLPVGFTLAQLGINLDPANLRINLTRAGGEVSHVVTTLMDPATGNFSIPGLGPGFYYPTLNLPPGAFVKNIRAMHFSPVPGVPRDKWPCSALPTGAYSYLDGHGHLQALKLPRMIVTDTVDDPFCLNIEVSFAGRIMGRAVTLEGCPDPFGCYEGGDMIVLLPQSAWAKFADNGITPPDRILTTVSERGGRFEFRGLPPGDYKVFALRDRDPEIIYHPDFSTVFGTRTMRVLYNSIDPCEDPAFRRAPGHDLPCEVMRPSINDLDLLVDRLYQ